MFLITCGVLVAFIDHAGVYILKLCPWCSLDLQEKLKQPALLALIVGQVFYYSSLGQQFGAVTAWEMFGVVFVVAILIPSLAYTAFQKRKAAVADGSLLMPLCEDSVPTPTNKKQASIGNVTGLNFAIEVPQQFGIQIQLCSQLHRPKSRLPTRICHSLWPTHSQMLEVSSSWPSFGA